MKLLLAIVILVSAWAKLDAQSKSDSIVKRLKLECKQFSRQGQYDSAYYTAERLNVYAVKLQDTMSLLNSYWRLGFYANKDGNPVQALSQYNEGIGLKTSLSLEGYKLPLLYKMCGILTKVGDYREAQKSAIYGIELSKKLDSTSYVYDFYNEFAIASANNLEFDAADEAYQSALDYATKNFEKIVILNNIGVHYKHQKKYKQAVKIYDSILNNMELLSLGQKAKIQSNLGFALSELGDKKRSLPLLKSALKIRIKRGKYSEIFASYIHLWGYYSTIDKMKAISFARKAYEVALNKTKSPDSQEEALLNIISLNAATDEEVKRYTFLVDSIQRAERRAMNEYTAAKFRIQEREVEIAKSNAERSYYFLGFITTTLFLMSFLIYVHQRRRILTRNHQIETLKALENERNTISGKVHDYVVDKIRQAMLFADHCEVQHPNVGFALVGDKVENAYKELRKVSQDYMCLDFDKIAFPKRIQGLLEEREELYSIVMDAEGLGDLDWMKIEITVKTELYRSLQELLINISKHSKATQVSALFKEDKKQAFMIVKDNGVGCDFLESMESTGLIDLKRRIIKLDGSVQIFSKPNHGFQVEIGIPL